MSNNITTPATTTNNTTSSATHPRRAGFARLGRFAAAIGIAATSALALSAAPAEAAPPSFDIEPIDIDRLDLLPDTCLGWWCERAPQFFQPDLVTSSDYVPGDCSTRDGQTVKPYYFFISNNGVVDAGAHWTTVSVRGGSIVAVEPTSFGSAPGIVASPVSNTAKMSAPLAVDHHTDGLAAGGYYYIRIDVEGCDRNEVTVEANTHVGVDLLGSATPGPIYRIAETTRNNNNDTVTW